MAAAMRGNEDDNILERVCDLIGASEQRLLERVMKSVRESGLGHAPREETDWRDSVRGVSDLVFQAVYGVPFGYAEGVVGADPVVAYGILRGQRHRSHGVVAADWHALMRHFRDAYVELVESAGLGEDDEEVCRQFLHGVFDRFERGFTQGYAEAARSNSCELRPLRPHAWPAPWSVAEDAGGTAC